MEFSILALGYVPLLILLVLLIILLYRKEKHSAQPPSTSISTPNNVCSPTYPERGDEKEDILEDAPYSQRDYDMECLKNRICTLLERERLYLNPNIRVTDVAERLCTNKTYVAQAIKLKMNKNFCQLIHSYRVREAMRVYAANPEMSVTELARGVGFNSMTTFNSAFSRITGYTPAEWCREYRQKNTQEDDE